MKLYGPALLALLLTGCGSSDERQAAAPSAAATASAAMPVMGESVAMLAFGDSLLTGYGLENGESYPARLEAALRARGINARIANAGVSGDTTAAGLQRLAFTLDSQPVNPRLAIVSLGGNDMLRGLPPEETRANLDAILTELRRRGIEVVLLGMLAAPNLGREYAARFDPIYPQLAKKHGATLVPFFLQPLMDRPDLIQPDHVHPTAAGLDALVGSTLDTVAGEIGEVSPPVPAPPR